MQTHVDENHEQNPFPNAKALLIHCDSCGHLLDALEIEPDDINSFYNQAIRQELYADPIKDCFYCPDRQSENQSPNFKNTPRGFKGNQINREHPKPGMPLKITREEAQIRFDA